MLRRTFALAKLQKSSQQLVLGIRREDKNVWERRVPLNPGHVKHLVNQGVRVLVQPSAIRCFSDEDYLGVGAEVQEDLTPAQTIVAVKEVPIEKLMPDRSYMFFSHTIKAQPYNMPLLDAIIAKNIRLFDYERINDDDGRMVKFGPFAGFAGTIDSLHALGLAFLTRGFATPFLHLSLAKEYRSLESARAALHEVGEIIRTKGLPEECCPLTFVVTSQGSVSQAVQQILHHLPCKYVEPQDLKRVWNMKKKDRHAIYVSVVTAKDMVVPKDPSKKFNSREYYQHPENFEPTFHEEIAPYTRVLMNGMYWEPRFPRLLTTLQARELHKQGRLPLVMLGDITCDIGGSVEFLVKATTIQNPFFVFDLEQNKDIPIADFNGDGVIVLGVDHLPSEFPQESSSTFGDNLLPLVEKVLVSDIKAPLSEQKEVLGTSLFNSMVTYGGALTERFQYIQKLRAERDKDVKKRRILVVGAGMSSGPCIRHLLDNPENVVTVIDSSEEALHTMKTNWGGSEGNCGLGDLTAGHSVLGTQLVDVSKSMTQVESMIEKSDVIISFAPATMHAPILKAAIEHKKYAVTASYISPEVRGLDELCKKNGVAIINEMGLDPGIDIMTSAKLLNQIRQEGGHIRSYESYCGALPQPENSDGPMGYKFSWSPRGVLTAAKRPASFKARNKWMTLPGDMLYHFAQPFNIFAGLGLEVVPNGNAKDFVECYGLQEAHTVIRGTIRYHSFAPVIRACAEIGLLDETTARPELQSKSTGFTSWATLMRSLVKPGTTSKACPRAEVAQFLTSTIGKRRAEMTVMEQAAALGLTPDLINRQLVEHEVSLIMREFEALGIMSEQQLVPKTATGFLLDSLCAQILPIMKLRGHERDFVLMVHRIVADFPRTNQRRTYVSKLALRGKSPVLTATSLTVGLPAALATDMVLRGELAGKTGLIRPTDPDLYNPILRLLANQGISMFEDVTTEPIPWDGGAHLP